MLACEAPAFIRPVAWGEGGGEGNAYELRFSLSLKNEYDISFDMQSKLAIMSFSFRVSQANLRGSKISRGRSPPWFDRISSSARWVLSRSAVDLRASFEDAIVSNAVAIKMTDTLWPFEIVMERLCALLDDPFAVDKEGDCARKSCLLSPVCS
jgi:hypothetical protein